MKLFFFTTTFNQNRSVMQISVVTSHVIANIGQGSANSVMDPHLLLEDPDPSPNFSPFGSGSGCGSRGRIQKKPKKHKKILKQIVSQKFNQNYRIFSNFTYSFWGYYFFLPWIFFSCPYQQYMIFTVVTKLFQCTEIL